jgi:membrane dipeptidase
MRINSIYSRRDLIGSKAAFIVASTMGIDTHNHIDVPLTAADVPGPDLDLVGEMKWSGSRPSARRSLS